jgi:hypothetical protein
LPFDEWGMVGLSVVILNGDVFMARQTQLIEVRL